MERRYSPTAYRPTSGVEKRHLCAWLERGGKALGPPVYCGLGSPDLPRSVVTDRGALLPQRRVPTRHAEIAALAQQAAARFKGRRFRRATLVVIRYKPPVAGHLEAQRRDANDRSVLCSDQPCRDCLRAAKCVGIRNVVFVSSGIIVNNDWADPVPEVEGVLQRARLADMRAPPSYGGAWCSDGVPEDPPKPYVQGGGSGRRGRRRGNKR